MCLWLYQYIIWIAVVAIFVFSIGFADSFALSVCICMCVSVSFGFKFLLIAICATMRRSRPHTLPDPPHTRCSRETPTPPSRSQPDDLTLHQRRRLRSWAVKGHSRAELDLLQFCSTSVGSDASFASQPLACAGLRPLAGRRRRRFVDVLSLVFVCLREFDIYIFFLECICCCCGAGFVFVRASRRSPRQFFSINVATIW